MKFGDVVTAVATLIVLGTILSFLLGLVTLEIFDLAWGLNIGSILATFISSIIVGTVFAKCIWEDRTMAIGRIVALTGVFVILNVMFLGASDNFGSWVRETYLEAKPTADLSAYEWLIVENQMLTMMAAVNALILLAVSGIGLYIGSAFKKPQAAT